MFSASKPPQSHTCLPVTLGWRGRSWKTTALIDTGEEECFLDTETAQRWGIPLEVLERPLVANTLTGQKIASVAHITLPVSLRISGNHQEELRLHIIDSPNAPIVLGHPWMTRHTPEIDWASHEVRGWSPACLHSCLMHAHVDVPVPTPEGTPDLGSATGIP